jgi:hypothetical protein
VWRVHEVWKIVGECPAYEISNLGRVRRIGRAKAARVGRILSQRMSGPKGRQYFHVYLWQNNKRTTRPVHRLVALAFVPNPNSLPQVNHEDGNKQNCRINNLAWITNAGNQIHAIKTGLIKTKRNVYLYKRTGRWMARLGNKYIGYFDTRQQALAARAIAEQESEQWNQP